MENYTYDGKFWGNILIVGQTGCGKTSFIQKLAVNNFFGVLKKAEWVSYIPLTKTREAEIESNFSCKLDFWYPRSPDELGDITEEFKQKSRSEEEISGSYSVAKNFLEKKRNATGLLFLTTFQV